PPATSRRVPSFSIAVMLFAISSVLCASAVAAKSGQAAVRLVTRVLRRGLVFMTASSYEIRRRLTVPCWHGRRRGVISAPSRRDPARVGVGRSVEQCVQYHRLDHGGLPSAVRRTEVPPRRRHLRAASHQGDGAALLPGAEGGLVQS